MIMRFSVCNLYRTVIIQTNKDNKMRYNKIGNGDNIRLLFSVALVLVTTLIIYGAVTNRIMVIMFEMRSISKFSLIFFVIAIGFFVLLYCKFIDKLTN